MYRAEQINLKEAATEEKQQKNHPQIGSKQKLTMRRNIFFSLFSCEWELRVCMDHLADVYKYKKNEEEEGKKMKSLKRNVCVCVFFFCLTSHHKFTMTRLSEHRWKIPQRKMAIFYCDSQTIEL